MKERQALLAFRHANAGRNPETRTWKALFSSPGEKAAKEAPLICGTCF